MLSQESKWQATGEPELVNCLVMGIPTSSGKRAVWLCLHAVLKPGSVLMDTWGAAPCQLGAGQGAAASAVGLAGAKPSSSLSWPQCMSGVWGAHTRPWGLKIAGKVWEHRLGSHGLVCKRAKTPCQLGWLCELLLQDGLGQRAAALFTSSGLGVVCLACGKHKSLVPNSRLCQISLWQLLVVLPTPQGHCGISAAHLYGPWVVQSCRGQGGHLPVTAASRAAGWVFLLFHSGGTETQTVGCFFRHWNVVSVGDGYKQATASLGKEMNSLPVIISKEQ